MEDGDLAVDQSFSFYRLTKTDVRALQNFVVQIIWRSSAKYSIRMLGEKTPSNLKLL